MAKLTRFLLSAAIAVGVSLSACAEFSAWVYDYGSNTPRATQETWTEANLVDTSAGAANATFSGVYNNEKNCFDGQTNTRWIQQTKTPWVIYRFPAATKITAYGVRQATNNGYDSRVPISWELYGSNAETAPTTADDASWEKLDERTSAFHNFSNGGNYDFKSRVMWLGQPANYSSYLLKVKSNNGDDYTAIGELEFYYIPVVVPVFGDCTFDYIQDGEYALSGVFTENAPTSLSLVLTPEGDGEAKVIGLGTPAVGVPFERTVSATGDGLSTTVWYSAKLVAESENGSSEKQLGRFWFGQTPRPFLYAKKIEFSVSSAIAETLGESTMTDFPVLVRLSSESVADYDPSAFVYEGRDLLFTDEDGNWLSFELDAFDPNGETLVWVKVPSLSATTKFICYYGGPENVLNEPTDVWSGYLGVWHFNGQENGVTPNATANTGLDGGSGQFTSLSGADTPFGSTAVQAVKTIDVNDYEPTYNVGKRFSASGWFKVPAQDSSTYSTFITKKAGLSWDANTGWYLEMSQSKTKMTLVPSSSTTAACTSVPDVTANWNYFTITHDNGSTKVYLNGSTSPVISQTSAINASSTMFKMLAPGQQGDEYRLSKSTWSALRASLEYKSMKNADFLSNSGSSAMDVTAPVFETPVVTVSNDGTVSVSITVTDGEGDVYLMVNGEKVEPKLGTIGTDITIGTPIVAHPTVAENVCASIAVYGINAKDTEVVKPANSGVMNAAVVATVVKDAQEQGLGNGQFTIARAEGAANDVNLVVNLSWAGTGDHPAVAGKNYVANLPSSVTIPAGEDSVTVEVTPLIDHDSTTDTELTLTIAGGAYISGASAAMTILHLVAPAEYNTWVAAADGLASDGANWSKGVPQSDHKILFDPQFSNANCEWDGGVNGLATSVAEWTQAEGFTGTITFDTTYTGAFTSLSVAGDVTLNGGTWTHQRGAVNNSTPTCRLKVTTGGAFTLGAEAKVDLKAKGLAGGQKPSGSSAGSHASSCDGYAKIYGNVYAPDMPGSGSNGSNYWGGGAFWLEAAGAATIDGTITVRPDEKDGIKQPAAGSVYVKAASCGGSGHIYADYEATSSYNGGGGSAGRVAIILTEATELAFPEANVAIKGRLTAGTHGSGGTFYYKTASQTNGTLVLDDVREKNYAVRWPKPTHITAIPAGETWTFDAIKIRRYGMLAIPEGTTLNLPNGPQSVSASSTRQGGLLYQGGTINWGSAPYVFADNWIFQPNVPFTFDGDVTIADKGAIGCMIYQGEKDFSDMAKCEFTVNGDLTIDNGGAIYAKAGGPDQGVSRNSYAAHGGATMNVDCLNTVYDSIFNPSYPGYTAANGDQATSRSGGGLVKFTVNGDLVVNGTINAEGWLNGDQGAAGSGGTVNIVAQTLSGEGSMTVDATRDSRWTYYNVGGAGRIAVRLTDGTFSDYWKSHITAKGRSWWDSSKSVEYGASAGTVYLQEKGVAEKAGEIIVKNDNVDDEHKPYTYLPVTSTKTPTDAIDDFKNAGMTLSDKALVKVSTTFKLRALTIAENSKLDLNGNTLTVKKAVLGDTKLVAGTYAAGDAALGDFVTDSADGGSVTVLGTGLLLTFR